MSDEWQMRMGNNGEVRRETWAEKIRRESRAAAEILHSVPFTFVLPGVGFWEVRLHDFHYNHKRKEPSDWRGGAWTAAPANCPPTCGYGRLMPEGIFTVMRHWRPMGGGLYHLTLEVLLSFCDEREWASIRARAGETDSDSSAG